jgi:hypothetical protein
MSKNPQDEAEKQRQRESMAQKLREEEERKRAEWQQVVEQVVSKVGRPTLYDPKYCEEVVRYFLANPPYKVQMTMFGPKMTPCDLPTLAGFAVSIGVCKKTINNWCDEHPEFLHAVEIAKAVQEHIWATNTLHKLYDKTFSIFFGKNNLDYVEKVVQEIEDKRDDPVETLARRLFDEASGGADTGTDAQPPRVDDTAEGGVVSGRDASVSGVLRDGTEKGALPLPGAGGMGDPA